MIYDPGGELKFSCPPQTELSNETVALFIIKAANSEFWVPKRALTAGILPLPCLPLASGTWSWFQA